MDILTQYKPTVFSEVLMENGQTVETAVNIVTQNRQTEESEVLKDSGQTLKVSSVRYEAE